MTHMAHVCSECNRPTARPPDGRRPLHLDLLSFRAGARKLVEVVQHFAADGLSDFEIAWLIADYVGDLWPALGWLTGDCIAPPDQPQDDPDLALAGRLARCLAEIGLPPERIVALLAALAAEVAGWPDLDNIIAIVTACMGEMSDGGGSPEP